MLPFGMAKKRQRSPQEKKALSYERDCRNDYGESPHGSRKAIPAHKTRQHQQIRRSAKQALQMAERGDDEAVALVESDIRQEIARVGRWKKHPDRALGDFLILRDKRIGR